jgi:hypothetical protein
MGKYNKRTKRPNAGGKNKNRTGRQKFTSPDGENQLKAYENKTIRRRSSKHY